MTSEQARALSRACRKLWNGRQSGPELRKGLEIARCRSAIADKARPCSNHLSACFSGDVKSEPCSGGLLGPSRFPAKSAASSRRRHTDDPKNTIFATAIRPADRTSRSHSDQSCSNRSQNRHSTVGNICIVRIDELHDATSACAFIDKVNERVHHHGLVRQCICVPQLRAIKFRHQHCANHGLATLCAQSKRKKGVTFSRTHIDRRPFGRGDC